MDSLATAQTNTYAEKIFLFDDPIAFVHFAFAQKKIRNPRFSMRMWSRQMGYPNPSLLSDVMCYRRKLHSNLAIKMAQSLKLSDEQKHYFEVLVLSKHSRTETEKDIYNQVLEKIRNQYPEILSSEIPLFPFPAKNRNRPS